MTGDKAARVTLEKIAEFHSGRTPSRARVDYFDGGTVPWVKTMDLTNGAIWATDESITPIAVRENSMFVHPVGTVLVAMYGGFVQIGRTGLLRTPAATNQAITAVRPNSRRVDSGFLLHTLNYRVSYWRNVAASSRKDPNITKDDIRRFPIKLPALEEQRAIAEALSDADDLISTLERLITKKERIKRALRQALLTGKTRMPGFSEQWMKTTLGELGTFSKGRGIKRDDVRASGLACVRYGEIYTEFDDYTRHARSFVSVDVAASALSLRRGDILFAGSGETREEIGKCVAYLGPEPAVAGGDIVALRGTGYDPMFVALIANAPHAVQQKARAGQGDAVVHINSRALAAIDVALPPIDEQEAIARVLLDADDELAVLRARLDKAKAIKQGMMQELLTSCTRLPVPQVAAVAEPTVVAA